VRWRAAQYHEAGGVGGNPRSDPLFYLGLFTLKLLTRVYYYPPPPSPWNHRVRRC
jgi:hypothetical protein